MTDPSLYQLYLVADRAHKLLDRAGVERYTTELQPGTASRLHGHVSVASFSSGQRTIEKVQALLGEEPELDAKLWGRSQLQLGLTTNVGIRLVIPLGAVTSSELDEMRDAGITITEV